MKKKWLILCIISTLFILSTPVVYSYFSPKIVSQPTIGPYENALFLIEGHPFPYQPAVRYDIPVTWKLHVSPVDSSPDNLQISIAADTGNISWNDKRAGIWQVTLTAANWSGRDSQTFKVKHIVKPFIKMNLPSTITAHDDFSSYLDVSGSKPLEITCSNPDIVIEGRSIHWPEPVAGEYSIQFTASNPAGSDDKDWAVNVEEFPVKITSKPRKITIAGSDYKYEITVTGTPEFIWELLDAPKGMTIGSKGIVLWPANSAKEGKYKVRVKVTNSVSGKTHTDTQTYTLECKQQEKKKVKKKQQKKLTNVNVKKVYKEDKVIKEQKEILDDQKKLLKDLPKEHKQKQAKAIDTQKEVIKRAEEARKRALELKKQKDEETRLEAERREKERERIEAEKLMEALRLQEEAERQRLLKVQIEAQKEAEQREKEKQEELRKKEVEQQEKERLEELRKKEALRRQQEAEKEEARKQAELLKQQERELYRKQEVAKHKQEIARQKYLKEQQALRDAAEKARLEQEKVAMEFRRQEELKRQAEEAEIIAKRQRELEARLQKQEEARKQAELLKQQKLEQLKKDQEAKRRQEEARKRYELEKKQAEDEARRKQNEIKKVSVPSRGDISQDKIKKGKSVDLRYDFVMTGWSFTDFNRLAGSREFKILFMPNFKAIQPENYEVTGLDGSGKPVIKKRKWDSNYYSSKGCIVEDIPTEGKNHWKDYNTHLRRKHKLGSHTMTLFFPYHFFTYLEEAARSYYNANKINPTLQFTKGAGKIKFTITKDYKFRIISTDNTQ